MPLDEMSGERFVVLSGKHCVPQIPFWSDGRSNDRASQRRGLSS
jgi:hypothetical protein